VTDNGRLDSSSGIEPLGKACLGGLGVEFVLERQVSLVSQGVQRVDDPAEIEMSLAQHDSLKAAVHADGAVLQVNMDDVLAHGPERHAIVDARGHNVARIVQDSKVRGARLIGQGDAVLRIPRDAAAVCLVAHV